MRTGTLFFVLLCGLIQPLIAAADEGSCDQSADRVEKFVYAKIEGYVENDQSVEFVEACTDQRRKVKRCAIERSAKHQLHKACSPKDGTPDYFEPAYRIDYMEERGK